MDDVRLSDITTVNLDKVNYMKQIGSMVVLYLDNGRQLLLTPEESEELGRVLRERKENREGR